MILITGGAGYIGSHCVFELLKQQKNVIIFDNYSTGHIETVEKLSKIHKITSIRGDLTDFNSINEVFSQYNIDAVIHFAAFSQVAESVINPQKYYTNNVTGTINLLNAMINHNVKKIVFSSTAAIYGEPQYLPIDEKHPKNPINTYGKTKLMIENIMEDYDKAYNLKSVRLRYFNVAGANVDGLIGEWHEPETHLIPNILKSVYGENKTFKMFGTDYDTIDGTCVRDYINVEDLAQAHLLALNYLDNGGDTNYFNLGTNDGNSVKEVFTLCENITGQKINIEICPRREGDPDSLVADNTKSKNILGWIPKNDLSQSIQSAYNWEKILQNNMK